MAGDKTLQVPANGGLPTATDTPKFAGSVTVPKESGTAIRVDPDSPSYTWQDQRGLIIVDAGGPNAPTLTTFRGNIKQWQFLNTGLDEVFMEFHILHDYVLGTNIFIHAHWAQIIVDTGGPASAPGNVKWQFEATVAKGHDQAAFPATVTAFITQTASTTQYQHMIAETQLSAAAPNAGQIDTDDLEPDSIILIRAFRDPDDASDTLNQAPFLLEVDLHYQSSNIGTKAKTPNFYA